MSYKDSICYHKLKQESTNALSQQIQTLWTPLSDTHFTFHALTWMCN